MSDVWLPKGHYPELLNAEYIAIDCETKDPNLLEMGPGDRRGDGYVVGISVAVPGFKAYYPIAHEGGDNLPKDTVVRYLRRQLSGREPKVGGNIIYDLGWLETEGIIVNGPKMDIQIAEALLDELQESYSVNTLCTKYLDIGKDETLLTQACAARGWTTEKQIKGNLWRLPARFVGPYGERDADGALQVLMKQLPLLEEQELMKVFELECRLTDVLHKTRLRGLPISFEKAEKAVMQLRAEHKIAQAQVNHLGDGWIDVWSNGSLSAACTKLGIPFNLTEKGNPSFTADFLEVSPHDFLNKVLLTRQLDRTGSVFIENKVLNYSVKGRLHPNYRQTRSERGGTKSGRLASSNPNMQQVPNRNPILAPIVRGVFCADEGSDFGVFDYSQQEPRITVHYACMRDYKGAAEARQRYIDDPRTDYHQLVADMMEKVSGRYWGRKISKPINLGLSYGMGKNKLAAELGVTPEEAGPIIKAYTAAVPFVREIAEDAMRKAKRQGFIKTLYGRRRHFPGGQFAHKALNAAVQGSAADMMKLAMVHLDAAGFDIYNVVHDEVDAPVEKGNKKQLIEMRDIMIHALPISVPLLVDVEVGPSWGECVLMEL